MIHRCYETTDGAMYPIVKLRALKAANKQIGLAIHTPGMTFTEQSTLMKAIDLINSIIPEVVR
jgi:hypothetical protein